METALLLLLVIGFGAIIFLLNKKLSEIKESKSDTAILEWLKSMQANVNTNSSEMNRVLAENSKQLNERLDRGT